MKADLAPDDFDGLMQAHRDQARLRNLSQADEGAPCSPAESSALTLGTALLFAAPLAAFIFFMVF